MAFTPALAKTSARVRVVATGTARSNRQTSAVPARATQGASRRARRLGNRSLPGLAPSRGAAAVRERPAADRRPGIQASAASANIAPRLLHHPRRSPTKSAYFVPAVKPQPRRWTPTAPPRYASRLLIARVAELADAPDLGSGTARCGGSSPSSCTTAKALNKTESSPKPGGEREQRGDFSVDDSPRARLVEGLTDALRHMLLAGDVEGSQVALRALGDLARLADKRGPNGAIADNVTQLPSARDRARREP